MQFAFDDKQRGTAARISFGVHPGVNRFARTFGTAMSVVGVAYCVQQWPRTYDVCEPRDSAYKCLDGMQPAVFTATSTGLVDQRDAISRIEVGEVFRIAPSST